MTHYSIRSSIPGVKDPNIGTLRQTIIQLEKREYNPSLKLAFRIANVLGINLEDLFTVTDEDLDPKLD